MLQINVSEQIQKLNNFSLNFELKSDSDNEKV